MKFESFSGSRRSRRHDGLAFTPAMIESLETKALLAGPQVVTPTGTITDSTPVISWEAVDNAVSYDLWVSDVESRERLIYETGLTTTNFTPTTEFHLGRNRIWVRANFAAAPSTAWGTPTDALLQVAPVITGPVNTTPGESASKINSTTTPVRWESAPGAKAFDIFLSNQTTQTSTTIRVPNLVPIGDANGNPIPDGKGDVLRAEVREYYLSGEVPVVGATPKAITAATNTSSIVITSVAHGLKSGETVRITDVGGNTAANGTFKVKVLTADTFELTGVSGNASYTTGGMFVQLTQLRSELPMGQYRLFMRTIDDAGRVSGWSSAFDFEVAPSVQILRPAGPTFQSPITLEWKAVENATHYEVDVFRVVNGVADTTALYNVKYLQTTSYTLPKTLAAGTYEFRVRARRLTQVSEVSLQGNPTAGTFKISLKTPGVNGKTVTTVSLPYNATEAQVRTAIRALDGFATADVTTGGVAPNLKHSIALPQFSGPVTVSVISAISPGTISVNSKTSPEVIGLWSTQTRFSTIQTPVITKPVSVIPNSPDVITVTSVRPTIEWTAIDKAARYELWVDRTASSTTYLKTNVGTNSYTFDSDILPGNYWVWVRAVSTTGVTTAWSTPYKFTATGGAPLITFPTNGAFTDALPTIQWTSVPEAASYEIHVAWLGVDFDFIQVSGLTATNYVPVDPLTPGSYRVWVRAIAADGTAMRWSTPVTFIFETVQNQTAEQNDELVLLTSLLPNSETNTEGTPVVQAAPVKTTEPEQDVPQPEVAVSEKAPVRTNVPVENPDTPLIEKLAESLVHQEWWTIQNG